MAGERLEPLVGRSAEREQVARLVDDVSRGVARVAFIEGEAGIGKSRLLQASLDAAAKAGFRVAAGAARDLECDRAFGLIVDAFGLTDRATDDLQREIAGLIEGERGLSHSRFRVIERLVELVETIAIDRPLVIAAEDLHWADPSSILALDRLATSIEHLPVLLLCTARPAPRSTELTSLVGSFDAIEGARIVLGPLDGAAVDELVGRTLGADVGPRLAVKVGGAAGNPLFVTELLTALDQEGLIDLRDGTAEVGDVTTPPSLTLTILRRLAFLSDETLEVLRVASVLGTAFTMKDLTAVTGRQAVALL